MTRSVTMIAVSLLAAAVLGAIGPAGAGAKIAFAPCGSSNEIACGRLRVPLDPSGRIKGTIDLAIRRHRAPVGASRSAVVALAGGPGQPAIPFTEEFMELLGPALATRDLIVFDQRGTGKSGPLSCPVFHNRPNLAPAQAVARCARQIGPTRGLYTTPDTVADIEAIRVAGGYEKLVLYGTSYGTKVALQYAAEHPTHVEALVLDSVVSANGPEALQRSTFAAIPRVLRKLCSFKGCAHITRNPVSDLRRLVARMSRRPLRGRFFDGHGHAHLLRISSEDLLATLIDGDLDPVLRAEVPAAVRAALLGDTAQLARLDARAQTGEESERDFNVPLYYATTCEETLFPWSRTSSPARRLAEARARIAALPAGAAGPFDKSDMLAASDIPECASWPFATPAPPVVSAHLPAVPTLILSGAEDLRTPTADARRVAAMIPGAHLVLVPNAGHDVLGTEQGNCGLKDLHAFFAHRPLRRCRASRPPAYLAPTPLAPRRLDAVPPLHGYRGRTGRTLAAVALTLSDVGRQIALAATEEEDGETAAHYSIATGGLRGGFADLSLAGLRLQSYSYVPGVTLSGTIKQERVQLRVGGRSAAGGTLRLGPHDSLTGTLGGLPVRLPARSIAARAGGGSGSPSGARRRLRRLLRARARRGSARAARAIEQLVRTISRLRGQRSGARTLALIDYALAHPRAALRAQGG